MNFEMYREHLVRGFWFIAESGEDGHHRFTET